MMPNAAEMTALNAIGKRHQDKMGAKTGIMTQEEFDMEFLLILIEKYCLQPEHYEGNR